MKSCAFAAALLLFVLGSPGASSAEPPTIAFVAGEFEYSSKKTLPVFARQLAEQYNVKTFLLERPDDPKVESIPGLEKLVQADLVVLMVRRMTLPEEQLNHFKKYFDSGKPLIGLRTASHAFQNWKEFDAVVLGGNYQNHHGNRFKTEVSLIPEARNHPILRGVTGFVSDGSLYKNTPLRERTTPLLLGTIEVAPSEPLAWTHSYKGGRIFYTSLGHPNDFKNDSFLNLLRNAIEWGLDRPLEKKDSR
jgi:type 1 glutamine amidotransferase